MKILFIATLLIAGMLTTYTQACTRVVYLGKNGMVVTGRTMDWKEDLKSNIYVFPRGIERAGADKGNTIHWKSKYGSVITAGYDIGTSDGMNERFGSQSPIPDRIRLLPSERHSSGYGNQYLDPVCT